jgi:hypothetical protein
VGYIGIMVLFGALKGMSPPAWRDLWWGGLSSLGLMALTFWSVRHAPGRLRAVGAGVEGRSALRLLAGVAVGFALYALIFLLISLVAGPLTLAPTTGGASVGGAMLVVVSFLVLSAMEELGFRGYPLFTLAPVIGEWQAQLLVAFAFGLSHILYGWAWPTVLVGVIPSGLLFGVAARASGGLAFPIGLHAALNLGAWGLGMKEAPGIWTVVIPEGLAGRVGAVATWIGLGVTLAAALLLDYGRGRGVTRILAAASPAS